MSHRKASASRLSAQLLAVGVAGALALTGTAVSLVNPGAGAAATAAPPAPATVTTAAAATTDAPTVGENVAPATPVAPPTLTILTNRGGLAPGDIFFGPKTETTPPSGAPAGPEIATSTGQPVFYDPLPGAVTATDVRVQTYLGHRVLTYWQGDSLSGAGHGEGVDVIVNRHYHVIATVHADRGLSADQHEFLLLPHGRALLEAYTEKTVNATSVGGPRDQKVLDGVVQEVNVRTGRLLFQWDALSHVALRDSYQPLPASADIPWDYFHINAVRPDTDGNLIIGSRHTWTVYKVNRRTGDIIWRLGGKQSSFTLGPGVRFAWQHDPDPLGHGDYRIFDNGSNGVDRVHKRTRIITVHIDLATHHATLLHSLVHPGTLQADSQGNSQLLGDGHLFVGWGATGRISEFSRSGRLLLDAQLPVGYDTYRAYRNTWDGQPDSRPTVLAAASGDQTAVQAFWNGATQVRRWEIRAGASATDLATVATVAWNGLDTTTQIAGHPAVVEVVALGENGTVLASSPATST